MTKPKFTQGPWQAECVCIMGEYSNPHDGYEITNGYKRIAEYVTEADARLIAAAPELYEALRVLVEHRSDCFIPEDSLPGLYDWTEKARAALAKADGEDHA